MVLRHASIMMTMPYSWFYESIGSILVPYDMKMGNNM
jgi:hypothetical protein